jgi:membrane glycosyltransferase
VNRLHFTLGILSYLASPLWLAFIVLSLVVAFRAGGLDLDGASGTVMRTALPWSSPAQAAGLFAFTLVLLFAPKILALLDLRDRPRELAHFGGWRKLAGGILTETVTFTLAAPVLMLFHTKFVILTLCRQSITWGTQRRGRAGESAWREAVSAHLGHTAFGVVLAVVAVRVDPSLAGWLSPLLAGLILSIPISYVTGCLGAGLWLRDRGILITPEESAPSPDLQELNAELAAVRSGKEPGAELASDAGMLQAVLDPYVNAVHVSLLRAKDDPPPATVQRMAELRDKLLREGPSSLPLRDKVAVLSDLDSMVTLHEAVWSAPSSQLNRWWQLALDHYKTFGPPPQTALSAEAA